MTRQIWAPWRLAYVGSASEQEGCVFCREAKGELADDESLVVRQGELVLCVLNKFPYASGHLMIAPARHVGRLDALKPEEARELHTFTVAALAAIEAVYGPDAFNVGLNLGKAAGGSISEHLHQHVVPRWAGDTNFMPVLADVKVLPEHLRESRARLTAAWPA